MARKKTPAPPPIALADARARIDSIDRNIQA